MLLQTYYGGTGVSIAVHFTKEPTRETFAYLAKWCEFHAQTWEQPELADSPTVVITREISNE